MNTMVKVMQLQYAATLYPTYQDYGGRGIYGDKTIFKAEEDVAPKFE